MYIYMLTIVVQTAWPNELKFVEGTHGFPGSNKNKKSTFFLQIPKKLYKCIYFACLSVCLSACMYPLNVKMAEPIEPNKF